MARRNGYVYLVTLSAYNSLSQGFRAKIAITHTVVTEEIQVKSHPFDDHRLSIITVKSSPIL